MKPAPPAPGIVWSSLPIPAILIDAEDRIAQANPAAETFLNASDKALRGSHALDRIAINARIEEAFARVRDNQAALFINDVDVAAGERAAIQCNIQIAPLTDTPATLLLLLSPRELGDRLGRAAQVQQAAKSAIGMAEMLAHEIKNPLAGIAGAAQLLSMGLQGEDRELTDLIVEETRRIVKLLEQVEQFGNTRPPECKPVNVHDILDRARKSATVGFGQKMQFIEDYDPSLPAAWGDGDQLLQVFLNLLKNASQAAGNMGGVIRLHTFYDGSLRVRRKDGSRDSLPLQIEISDNGPGIPPEIASDIFEPFVSGRENGTGLGLALVSKIITDHGGWIAVDSVPGRTTFRVSLPVVPKDAANKSREEE